MNLLDFLFPKKCVGCKKAGAYLCVVCHKKVEFLDRPVCPVCQRQAIEGKTHPGCISRYSLDGLVVPLKYKFPIKEAIKKIKYKWIYTISELLISFVVAGFWKYDLPDFDLIVPVPLHAKRKRWRGFNQAEILAKDLSCRFKLKFADLLIRNRETRTQVGLKREDRVKNIKGAFSLRFAPFETTQGKQDKLSDIKGKKILLVDDVYTTGATMQEACRILKKSGASEVWALCVALG